MTRNNGSGRMDVAVRDSCSSNNDSVLFADSGVDEGVGVDRGEAVMGTVARRAEAASVKTSFMLKVYWVSVYAPAVSVWCS